MLLPDSTGKETSKLTSPGFHSPARKPQTLRCQISAILYAPLGLLSVRKTISHLQSQSGVEIELVLLQPEGSPEPAEDLAPLTVQAVSVPRGLTTAECWALGVKMARSPVVVFTEDHCFPEPGWAEALVEAHREEKWYAVGPAAENANDSTLLSRADMLMSFLDPLTNPEGPAPALMGHNTSYKKSVLEALPVETLISGLRCELLLHSSWGPDRCLHLPDARVRHVNISKPLPFLLHKFTGGVVFGAERCARWSALKRAVYLGGSCAIPALRLQRILTRLSPLGPARKNHLRASWPWLIPALILHAAGEALGYLLGPAVSPPFYRFYSRFEQRRWDMVSDRDGQIKYQVNI